MESYRILASGADVDGLPIECTYADVFVVLRDGAAQPSATDWEAQIHTDRSVSIAAARHDLAFDIPDGSRLRGVAIVRYSDGRRHLFRGDGELSGFVRESPPLA